jgi:hypothetical protein
LSVVSVVCCQVERSLRRADRSSRGVLMTVLRRRVWSRNIKNRCFIYIYDISSLRVNDLTLILLTWGKWWTPNNASKWQMGFNSAFKGLIVCKYKYINNQQNTLLYSVMYFVHNIFTNMFWPILLPSSG